MLVDLKGGVFVNPIPPEERIAGLGDLNKLPIGPTLPISGPRQPTPVLSEDEAEKEEIKTTS